MFCPGYCHVASADTCYLAGMILVVYLLVYCIVVHINCFATDSHHQKCLIGNHAPGRWCFVQVSPAVARTKVNLDKFGHQADRDFWDVDCCGPRSLGL